MVTANIKYTTGKGKVKTKSVRATFRGLNLLSYNFFLPDYNNKTGLLSIELSSAPISPGTNWLKVSHNLASASMSTTGKAIIPYISFAQVKYLGNKVKNASFSTVAVVKNTSATTVNVELSIRSSARISPKSATVANSSSAAPLATPPANAMTGPITNVSPTGASILGSVPTVSLSHLTLSDLMSFGTLLIVINGETRQVV